MENTEQKQVRSNDEIDLIELFVRMWSGLKDASFWILEQLQNLIIFTIRKSIWIAVFAILGVVYGYVVHVSLDDFYSSEASFRSNGISNAHVIDFINQFEGLISSQNHAAVAQRLEIEQEKVKDIKSIGAYFGIDINKDWVVDFVDFNNEYDPLDTLMRRMPTMVYIKIELWNEDVFKEVKGAILEYVSTNPFIIANNNVRIRQSEEYLQNIDLEIKKLDSLQKIQYFDVPKTQRASTNQMLVLNEKDMKLYHETLLSLKGSKQSVEKDLELYREPITVMQPFTELVVVKDEVFKKLIPKAFYFAILGFIVSLFWHYRKPIFAAVASKKS